MNDNQNQQAHALDLLAAIDPSLCSYNDWLRVGMALKNLGFDVQAWSDWSEMDPGRFRMGECESKWEGFDGDVGAGTLAYIARQQGNAVNGAGEELSFDVDIAVRTCDNDLTLPDCALGGPWDRVQQVTDFLRAAFEDNDLVRYVTNFHDDGTGKLEPGRGFCDRTAGQLVEELELYGDVPSAMGEGDPVAGALVGANPLDGKGVKDDNVAAFRSALVECDGQTIDVQLRLAKLLNLPYRAIVYSGNKSIHVLVKIDARNRAEYDQRVSTVYERCELAGLRVDHACKNPSRMVRLPGFERDGRRQVLIATEGGAESYEAWLTYVEATEEPRLPATVNLASALPTRPPLQEELIRGVLRRTHKLIISAPSKAGKSFALIELCIAAATGGDWMGFGCSEGRVLYVNLELDEASCLERFHAVADALGLDDQDLGGVDVLNLRGFSAPLDELSDEIVARVRYEQSDYDLVVLDPIYKVLTGDENSATEMSKLVAAIDRISHELGCAVAYAHHYAKGSPGMKEPLDRMSGSGVFARDPDAILDLCPLKVPPEALKSAGRDPKSPTPAFRLTLILREFKAPKPVDLWFDHPLHEVDASGALAECQEVGKPGRPKGSKGGAKTSRPDLMAALLSDGQWHPRHEVAEALGVSTKTIDRDVRDDDRFERVDGKVRLAP